MKRSHFVLIFLIAAPVFALVGAILLLIAYANAFDPTVSRYFTAGNPLPTIAAILLGLSIVCGIVGAILAKNCPESLSTARVPFKADLLAAAGAFGTAIWFFIASQALLGILMVFAAGLFALCAFSISKIYGKYILWGGFAAIAAMVACNATYYFDMTVEMNAPTKILLQMAFLAALLYITAECRLLLERFDRLLIPILTILCMTLCISAGAVELYLMIAKKEIGTTYFAAAPFLIGVGLTAAGRLAQMLLPEKKQPKPLAEKNEPVNEAEPAKPTESEESDE